MRSRIAAALLAAAGAASTGAQEPRSQAPTFRSATELVIIDTHVVARDGSPIQDLKPDQFEVFIDGRRRPVVTAEFVRAIAPAVPGAAARSASAAAPYPDGRVIVLAVDQTSFPVSGQAAAREAATRVVNKVAAEDYLGMVAFPGPVAIAPTRDRAVLREAITRISGLRVDLTASRFNISASEASRLKSRDTVATQEITGRLCNFIDPTCKQEVIQDGGRIADALEQQGAMSIGGIHGVLDVVGSLPGRKTLILVSAGLPMQPGGRPDLDSETTMIARRAAAANINLYVLYLNVHFLRFFSPEYGKRNYTLFDDITMFGYGLEKFADSAGGSFFKVEVDSDPFVDRALRETSASYVLAVQARPEDRDGKDHFIRVTVKQRGAALRYRRMVNIPKG